MIAFENIGSKSTYYDSLTIVGDRSLRVRKTASTCLCIGDIVNLRFESLTTIITIKLEKVTARGYKVYDPIVISQSIEDIAHVQPTDSSSSIISVSGLELCEKLTESQVEDREVQLPNTVVARAREESLSPPRNVMRHSTATKRDSSGLSNPGKRARKNLSRGAADDDSTDSDHDVLARESTRALPVLVSPSVPRTTTITAPAVIQLPLAVPAATQLPSPVVPAATQLPSSVAPAATQLPSVAPVAAQLPSVAPPELFKMPTPHPARLRSVESVPPLTRSQPIELPAEELQLPKTLPAVVSRESVARESVARESVARESVARESVARES
ncbi:MAG: hypothetical protein WC052_05780, partial [Patescibacteria group bacterium]